MKVKDLIDYLSEMKGDGYGEAEIVLHVNEEETGLGIIDLEERPGQIPHVILS